MQTTVPKLSVPAVGDFVIVSRQFGWEVIHVAKVSAKQIRGLKLSYRNYERTVRIEDCAFCGPEAVARQLLDRLKSSDALCDDEQRRANTRRAKRNADLIAEAQLSKAAPSDRDPSLCGEPLLNKDTP